MPLESTRQAYTCRHNVSCVECWQASNVMQVSSDMQMSFLLMRHQKRKQIHLKTREINWLIGKNPIYL